MIETDEREACEGDVYVRVSVNVCEGGSDCSWPTWCVRWVRAMMRQLAEVESEHADPFVQVVVETAKFAGIHSRQDG